MFKNKTILVTGTNKGIGLEFARQYLNEGFKVIATCRNLSKLEGLNALVKSFPDKLSIYQMELLDEKSIEDFSLEIKDIPIIALTAHALESDRVKALDCGADDFDTKPVDFKRLLEKIEGLLG